MEEAFLFLLNEWEGEQKCQVNIYVKHLYSYGEVENVEKEVLIGAEVGKVPDFDGIVAEIKKFEEYIVK